MGHQKAATALLLVLGLLGCAPENGFNRSFRSTNAEQIDDLRVLMTRHGIVHRDTEWDGRMQGVSYRTVDEPRVAELRGKLDRQVEVRFKEPEARDYLQNLLTQMKHDFIVSEKSDGTWIKWFPESAEQQSDVSMKVVQYMFDLQAKRLPTDCAPLASAPSNRILESDVRQPRARASRCGRQGSQPHGP
jgi:hypothetical protein